MRCDQYFGLNDWARCLVTRKQKVRESGLRIFADGTKNHFSRWRRIPLVRCQDIGVIRGDWKRQVAKLHRYTMPNGEQYVEYLQACTSSGGPCYFIALKDKHGTPLPASLWTAEEIARA